MLTGAAMRSNRKKMLGVGFVAPVRSSAARAAHRELRSLLRLFRAN